MAIYRYKFSKIFLVPLKIFIEIHRFDNIPVFKEAWKKWCEENIELIGNEERRLEAAGYKGNVLEKMYRSARYYYKNKPLEKKKAKKRRHYHRLDNTFLALMDAFVHSHREKPSTCYMHFLQSHTQDIKNIEGDMLFQGFEKEDIALKIKKTFKNRYFRLRTK